MCESMMHLNILLNLAYDIHLFLNNNDYMRMIKMIECLNFVKIILFGARMVLWVLGE